MSVRDYPVRDSFVTFAIVISGEVFVNVEPNGPNEALVIWDLPAEDKDWNYGVDMTYKLLQMGGCDQNVNEPPITKYNVQDRRTMLKVGWKIVV